MSHPLVGTELPMLGEALTIFGTMATIYFLYHHRIEKGTRARKEDLDIAKELEAAVKDHTEGQCHPLRLQVAFRALFNHTLHPDIICYLLKESRNPLVDVRRYLLAKEELRLDQPGRKVVLRDQRSRVRYQAALGVAFLAYAAGVVGLVRFEHLVTKTGFLNDLGLNLLWLGFLVFFGGLGLFRSTQIRMALSLTKGDPFMAPTPATTTKPIPLLPPDQLANQGTATTKTKARALPRRK